MLCSTCNNQTCLKSGKPCQEVERYLASGKDDGIKAYRRDWIRPRKTGGREYREIPISNLLYKEDLDKIDKISDN